MKPFSLVVISVLAIAGGTHLMSAHDFSLNSLPAQEKAEKKEKPGKMLRHVVLFKFKEDMSKAQIKEVTDAFAALPKKIKQIQDFEWGTDVSVENKAAGFTHGFIVSFASEKARDEYLPHPAHQEFVKLVGPRLDGVLVFDFWAKR